MWASKAECRALAPYEGAGSSCIGDVEIAEVSSVDLTNSRVLGEEFHASKAAVGST